MKNCAIVCEYNPFHVGHKYQIDETIRRGADKIFCIMSGQFVQSGLPAFCDKAIRAECAIKSGVAAVVELPAVYATASAQAFAEGALKIASGIKNITHIVMGATVESDIISELSDIKINHREPFNACLKNYLAQGKSYNAASTAALSEIYSNIHPDRDDISGILADPNNVLCIEYISAIDKYMPSVQPLVIRRIGARHNDTAPSDGYISATAIRKLAESGNFGAAEEFIPYDHDKIQAYIAEHSPDVSAYKQIALYCLKTATTEYISRLRNCSEGLEFLLKDGANRYDFNGIVSYITGKRYSKKRVYRLMLDAVLGIDKTAAEKQFITRLLACKRDFDFTLLPNIVKTNNAEIKRAAADKEIAEVLAIDEKAVALYNTISRTVGDYYNYSLVKV